MEYSFSSWNEDSFVLQFSDDEYDRMGQTDNNERLRRLSKRRDISQAMHEYVKLQSENYSDFEELRLNQIRESESAALPKHSPEKPQTTSTDMKKDKMVNVTKLIYQLLNTKVVIEKMCESSGRDLMFETKRGLPNGSQFDDFVQRYCPKCKTLQDDKNEATVKKFCPKCETILKYVCSKCHSKQYSKYQSLKLHWNKCEPTADTCKTLNSTDFLVEKTEIDYSREIIRYCSRCNRIEKNCTKWKEKVCQNCDQHLLYQCKKCKAEFNASSSLLYHMQSKCFPGQYKCNQCDFTSTSWQNLRQHVLNKHFDRKINCPRCFSVLKNEGSLRAHLVYCGVEPKFYCNCCAFKTKYKRSLQCHMKTAHNK